MEKKIIITALFFGVVAIISGAFGAHALKKFLNADQLQSFEVGVRYLMYHAFFLLFVGTTTFLLPQQKNTVYYLVLAGALLFSGSIFLLSTQSVTKINFKYLGPITPLGGLLLIVSWAYLIFIFLKRTF